MEGMEGVAVGAAIGGIVAVAAVVAAVFFVRKRNRERVTETVEEEAAEIPRPFVAGPAVRPALDEEIFMSDYGLSDHHRPHSPDSDEDIIPRESPKTDEQLDSDHHWVDDDIDSEE
jgi:hypothetical protein